MRSNSARGSRASRFRRSKPAQLPTQRRLRRRRGHGTARAGLQGGFGAALTKLEPRRALHQRDEHAGRAQRGRRLDSSNRSERPESSQAIECPHRPLRVPDPPGSPGDPGPCRWCADSSRLASPGRGIGRVAAPGYDGPSMAINRDKLYEEVWAEPMTKVAAKYVVSSSFLARVCERLRVPRPSRGYWAQLEVKRT